MERGAIDDRHCHRPHPGIRRGDRREVVLLASSNVDRAAAGRETDWAFHWPAWHQRPRRGRREAPSNINRIGADRQSNPCQHQRDQQDSQQLLHQRTSLSHNSFSSPCPLILPDPEDPRHPLSVSPNSLYPKRQTRRHNQGAGGYLMFPSSATPAITRSAMASDVAALRVGSPSAWIGRQVPPAPSNSHSPPTLIGVA